ncbi:unnamed protein product [Adineta ricciae]|uniref:nicotinamidase n=1 Tax=Adineta ricciae TaxID=249248 RepID=A0A813PEM7_ADIRI|nr:unnamed protein product [Adineta ricciae]CAF1427932.1 unnamed protein product [Adineta ricciae]
MLFLKFLLITTICIFFIEGKRRNEQKRIKKKTSKNVYALLIVDVQYCFINGSLALNRSSARQNAAEVIPIINKLIQTIPFDVFVYTMDWHPKDHISFIDNIKDRQEYVLGDHYEKYKIGDLVTYTGPKYWTQQVLWPTHCVQNTFEAQIAEDLIHPLPNQKVFYIKKGTDPDVDSYSAFADNNKLHMTILNEKLKSKHVTHVFISGLALDYCVAATALDAKRFNYKTFVIQDACRGVDEKTIKFQLNNFKKNHIRIVQSADIKKIIKHENQKTNL